MKKLRKTFYLHGKTTVGNPQPLSTIIGFVEFWGEPIMTARRHPEINENNPSVFSVYSVGSIFIEAKKRNGRSSNVELLPFWVISQLDEWEDCFIYPPHLLLSCRSRLRLHFCRRRRCLCHLHCQWNHVYQWMKRNSLFLYTPRRS